MSQEYFSGKGKGRMRQESEEDLYRDDRKAVKDVSKPKQKGHAASSASSASSPPAYMTVGSGSTSQHAAHLQALLENDSGYGSIAGDDTSRPEPLTPAASAAWRSSLREDIHTPPPNTDTERQSQAVAIHQLWYNSHRSTLARSIQRVVELLTELQEMNIKWPAHYPSVQRADTSPQRPSSRPGFHQTNTMSGDFDNFSHHHAPLRRSMTAIEPSDSEAESSKAAEQRAPEAPRLVTPQIAQQFSILKLDLKLGALHQTELVHSLEKSSVASLLDGKISSSIKHLYSLRERIEDTSSKVLITGDLNAGKSTFCNALLRRKILPEDQQPCTAIFCEVLDARENSGVEEVHAVHMDVSYNRVDESTYDVFPLYELEKIVTDNETYTQCKIYVKDVRTIDESLLNNGVVDIALIDAPGLNLDTSQTTAIFARQEEIDVVVFVVSAANHFTLTAQEFIWAAAAEKAYLFIVVNGYDNIRDKERCRKMILKQVAGMSPRTHKEAGELVHFVSSNAIPVAPPPSGGPNGSGGGSGSPYGGGGGGDDPGDLDPKGKGKGKGKGKDKEKIRDFGNLEQSLRRFVLEKRARSKLAPAKNYLLNILNDVHVLANVNTEVAQAEKDRVTKELEELEPMLESSERAKSEVSTEIDKTIEDTYKDVYDHTRSSLNFTISHVGHEGLGVPYPGLFGAFQYAEDLKEAMLSEISDSVVDCEEYARTMSVSGVNVIKNLGLFHLGNEYTELTFRPEVMFQRRKDVLARQVDIPTELRDFVDWSTLLQRQEKVAGTGMALTLATAVGSRMIGGNDWMGHAVSAARVLGNDNLRRMIVPGIVVAAISVTAYVLSQIPHSLPQRLQAKIEAQLSALDYVHTNSARVASSVRKVLRYPADDLRVKLARSAEQLGARRDETRRVQAESSVALKYFGNLVRNSANQRIVIEAVDLEAPPPGAAHLS